MKGCWDLSSYDEDKVVRCQKVVRGWIGRRRLQNLGTRSVPSLGCLSFCC